MKATFRQSAQCRPTIADFLRLLDKMADGIGALFAMGHSHDSPTCSCLTFFSVNLATSIWHPATATIALLLAFLPHDFEFLWAWTWPS